MTQDDAHLPVRTTANDELRHAAAIALRLVVLTVILAIGCKPPGRIHAVAIPIPESGDIRADLKLAKSVVDAVWADGLETAVAARFGSLSQRNLDSLFIRWEEVRTITTRGTSRRAQIVVGITHHRAEEGADIAKFCAEVVATRLRTAARSRRSGPGEASVSPAPRHYSSLPRDYPS